MADKLIVHPLPEGWKCTPTDDGALLTCDGYTVVLKKTSYRVLTGSTPVTIFKTEVDGTVPSDLEPWLRSLGV